MTTNAQVTPSTFGTYEATALPTGPILVASNGANDSDSAFPIAQILAANSTADVNVVSVLRPFASAMYAYDLVPVAMENEASVRAGRERAISEQFKRMVPDATSWPLMMRTGDVAREIVAYANATSARVIVTGRGRHNMVDRLLAGETVLRLLQLGDTPVLAVDEGLTRLPRRLVIATDFSEYSLYAAHVAISMAAPDATVYLVHVGPHYEHADGLLRDRAEAAHASAKSKLAEWGVMLAREEIEIREVVRAGTAASELLEFAEEIQADLVASSSHGYGFLRRTILGSVASALVRGATCSVLCVPGSARAVAAALARRAPHIGTRMFDMENIDAELAVFMERNQRRRCTVQVFRRDIGSQVLGHDLPIVGVTYDESTRSVSIMFGASLLAGHHLTHTIQGVIEVDVTTGEQSRDHVLRFVHNDGYTLVELE